MSPTYRAPNPPTQLVAGSRCTWSPDGQWVYYDKLDPDDLYELYRIKPDGSQETKLLDGIGGIPDYHRGNPTVDWTGNFVIFQVEAGAHTGPLGGEPAEPGIGVYNDLWVLDLRDMTVAQLTTVATGLPAGGSLHPKFQNRGHKIVWADRQDSGGRWGDWQLKLADFNPTTKTLQNIQTINPGPNPAALYEPGCWDPDDQSFLYAAEPIVGMDGYNMDICRTFLTSPTSLTRLTLTSGQSGEDGEWDEHPKIIPPGNRISLICTKPYGTDLDHDTTVWYRTEIWTMNLDGSDFERLTYFTDPTHPHFIHTDSFAKSHWWNPDRSRSPYQLAVPVKVRGTTNEFIYLLDVWRDTMAPTVQPSSLASGAIVRRSEKGVANTQLVVTITPKSPERIRYVTIAYSATVSVTPTIDLDSGAGVDYDIRVLAQPLINTVELVWTPDMIFNLLGDDQLVITCPAGGAGVTCAVSVVSEVL